MVKRNYLLMTQLWSILIKTHHINESTLQKYTVIRFSSFRMEEEMKSFAKLRKLEQILTQFLEKIDNEIDKTEVEWLNLKSISETKNCQEFSGPVPSSSGASNVSPKEINKESEGHTKNPNSSGENVAKWEDFKMENMDFLDDINLSLEPSCGRTKGLYDLGEVDSD
nr:uncharacterized protein LOC111517306 [Leptinotarsa decemlineata]